MDFWFCSIPAVRYLWLGVTEHPTAQWIAHQLSEAYGWANRRRNISFATGIVSMAMSLSVAFARWASEIGRSNRDHHGKMAIRKG